MSVRIIRGEARTAMSILPAGSIHLCVTSPPYYNLRSYAGGDQPVWGGTPGCDHDWQESVVPPRHGDDGATGSGLDGGKRNQGQSQRSETQHATCRRCGAWQGALGLEPTPGMFIAHLVEVFAGVRRVLHRTGVLAVNMGDSYAGTGAGQKSTGKSSIAPGDWPQSRPSFGIPAGNLLGIPWRLALALQADGWTLRSAICCIKTSTMPEPVAGCRWEPCRVKVAKSERTGNLKSGAVIYPGRDQRGSQRDVPFYSDDGLAEWSDCPGCERCAPNGGDVLRWGSGRPTSAYEMLFVFARGRRYFWDSEAVRVDSTPDMQRRAANGHNRGAGGRLDGSRQDHDTLRGEGAMEIAATGRNAWNYMRFEDTADAWYMAALHGAHAYRYLADQGVPEELLRAAMNHATAQIDRPDAPDVWQWRPAPFAESHFATFPPSLPAWCIKAATSQKGCCPTCRMPWAPVVERGAEDRAWQQASGGNRDGGYAGTATKDYGAAGAQDASAVKARILAGMRGRQTTRWRPTCRCPAADPVPCTVLDPFGGSGTTALAADRLGRDAVIIELSEEYAALARRRFQADAGLFADLTPDTTPGEPEAV